MVKSGALSPTCRLIVRLSGSGASMRAIYVRPAAADVNRRRGRDWPDRPRRFRLGGAGTADHEDAMTVTDRSEEHTSALQSLMRFTYTVFRMKQTNTPTRSRA